MLKAIQTFIKPQTLTQSPTNNKDKPTPKNNKEEHLKEWFVITMPANKLPQENYSQVKK